MHWSIPPSLLVVIQGVHLAAASSAPHTWKPTSSCDYTTTAPAYVSASLGADDASHGASLSAPFQTISYAVSQRLPCQTIYVMAGTYQNNNFNSGSLNNNAVVSLQGVSDLIITNYGSDKPVIEFDGAGGFVGGSVSTPAQNIEISGFEIIGPNAKITYADAMSARLKNIKYYKGRGIAIWAGDHIYLHDLIVHHCPSSGIRVNNGDYVTMSNNQVHSTTWWSSAAESAIVLATSKNIDDKDIVKMRLVSNVVYDNMNKIPYYNKKYSWDHSPIGNEDCASFSACEQGLIDGCPWTCRYGKASQDYIVDGMGVYVTRNKDTYLKGKMELNDNECYRNGINGLVVHRTDRTSVKRNLIYDNGRVPRLDKPESVQEDWHASVAGKSRQHYAGLVLNNADDVKLWSNSVSARYDDDYAFKQEVDGSGSPTPVEAGGNNKVCRGLVDMIPSSIVVTSSDSSTCGVRYEEMACGDQCHLIQWPYKMHQSYAASEARTECESACEAAAVEFGSCTGSGCSGCKAFSLQYDYNRKNGDKMCFLYKEAPEPQPAKCADDPLNTAGCSYHTKEGQFFITPVARAKYNVKDVAQLAP